MTLMRSVARAQGVSDYAATNYVVVFRQVWRQTKWQLCTTSGRFDKVSIQILKSTPTNVVYVGESAGRRAFQLAIQSGALLSGPLVAILK